MSAYDGRPSPEQVLPEAFHLKIVVVISQAKLVHNPRHEKKRPIPTKNFILKKMKRTESI